MVLAQLIANTANRDTHKRINISFMFINTIGEIINAYPRMGEPMTEEAKSFIANNDNNLLIRLGIIDEKGEPNIAPLAYHYDDVSNSIYFTTRVNTKKVSSLRRRNIVGYCIDDPNPPFKGVRGKGIVKIHEDVTYNITIAKTIAPIEDRCPELSAKLTLRPDDFRPK
jgi:pyridoxamine 5'-phosphate oxidase-like protein